MSCLNPCRLCHDGIALVLPRPQLRVKRHFGLIASRDILVGTLAKQDRHLRTVSSVGTARTNSIAQASHRQGLSSPIPLSADLHSRLTDEQSAFSDLTTKGTAALCCQHAGHIPIDRSHSLARQVFARLPALSACSMAPTWIGSGGTKVLMPSRRQRSSSGTRVLAYSLIFLHQR